MTAPGDQPQPSAVPAAAACCVHKQKGKDEMSKKNDKGIRLSPQHGVNPTLLKCFWCGGDAGIALLGKLKGDAEAPRETCLNLEPCDACKAKFKQGVQLIEVTEDGSRFNGNNAFALKDQDGQLHWPTGRFAILREGVIKDRKAGQTALCDTETMDHVLGPRQKEGK